MPAHPLDFFALSTAGKHQAFRLEVGKQSSYTRTDLRIIWMSEGDLLMVQGLPQNLEDKAILNRSVISGQGANFQNFAPPRIWGVKAGFNF